MCTSIRKSLNSCIRFIDWCIKNPFHSKGNWCKLHFLKLTEHGLKPLECHYAQIKICCLTFGCSGFNQCYSLGYLCKNQAQNTVFFPMKWHRKQWGSMHKQCTGPFRYNPTLKTVLFFFYTWCWGLHFSRVSLISQSFSLCCRPMFQPQPCQSLDELCSFTFHFSKPSVEIIFTICAVPRIFKCQSSWSRVLWHSSKVGKVALQILLGYDNDYAADNSSYALFKSSHHLIGYKKLHSGFGLSFIRYNLLFNLWAKIQLENEIFIKSKITHSSFQSHWQFKILQSIFLSLFSFIIIP